MMTSQLRPGPILQSILAAGLGLIVIVPPILFFPNMIGNPGHPIDVTGYLVAVVIAFPIVVLIAFGVLPIGGRRIALDILKVVALCSFVSLLICYLDARFPVIEIPIPHLLSRMLSLDGEFAYDADVFEIWSELFCLWVFGFLIFRWVWRKGTV